MSTIGTVVSEFKTDHTYTTTSGNNQGESRTYSGTWTLDGNVLTMTDQKATAVVQSTVTRKFRRSHYGDPASRKQNDAKGGNNF